ncbi:MAG: radical SAM protein [Desulfobacterales bacterium]|nr:radical SAM protein [Desulfobacterales bacterium]
MKTGDWRRRYLSLHPETALKKLETPFVYHAAKDELYEIDDRALDFLSKCDGTRTGRQLTDEAEFVEYCLEEQILETLTRPEKITIKVAQGDIPSLRYLELHLLHRCNLRCRHCYLGPPGTAEMPLSDAVGITRQFAENGGLRLLISGGEPLLYKHLADFLNRTRGLGIRRILFTNGTLLTPDKLGHLDTDEIQFSMDGWKAGHEHLRGKGTFDSLLRGVRAAKETDIDISFSTMIHSGNIDEFTQMENFIKEMGALEWGVDILTVTGSLAQHPDLCVPFETAAPLMEYAYGGGYHGSSDGYACGRHLMAVMPDRQAVKCGFYREMPLGDAAEGLADCWRRMPHIRLDELECRDCEYLNECRGGCRFRAPHPLAPDPAMCRLFGVENESENE